MQVPKILIRRSGAYRKTFSGPEGRKVLADLKRFCKATVPTANIKNVNATYLAEGRREVWLRILSHINLTDEEIHILTEEDE
jgi:hypothetical protein